MYSDAKSSLHGLVRERRKSERYPYGYRPIKGKVSCASFLYTPCNPTAESLQIVIPSKFPASTPKVSHFRLKGKRKKDKKEEETTLFLHFSAISHSPPSPFREIRPTRPTKTQALIQNHPQPTQKSPRNRVHPKREAERRETRGGQTPNSVQTQTLPKPGLGSLRTAFHPISARTDPKLGSRGLEKGIATFLVKNVKKGMSAPRSR